MKNSFFIFYLSMFILLSSTTPKKPHQSHKKESKLVFKNDGLTKKQHCILKAVYMYKKHSLKKVAKKKFVLQKKSITRKKNTTKEIPITKKRTTNLQEN